MFKRFYLPLMLLFVSLVSYTQKLTISGTIVSSKKGETIIGATIKVGKVFTTSNAYGFYSLSLDKGSYVMEVYALDFQLSRQDVVLDKDLIMNVSLLDEPKELGEVTVTASSSRRSLASPQMGVEKLSTQEVKNIPVIFGERDILKTIQLLPGIKPAGEGSSGFFVRGGAADQNLILLDEAPVYNASHLLGFFSTFNSDAIKDITMYKAGMPAQYGGRLSSVLDIKMNDGNIKDYNISGGIGTISAKLNVEGPIQQDKSSFLVTGRRTYVDMFLKMSQDSTINRNRLYFYDLNAKANYILGKKDRLFISGYFGKDHLGIANAYSMDWGNATATLRWNHVFTNRLFSNTSLIFSNYRYRIGIKTGADDFEINSEVRDWNLKQEMQLYLDGKHEVKFGANAIFHTIKPGELSTKSSSINPSYLQDRYSLENAVFASDTWKATEKLTITGGIRLSAFSILGKGDYFNIDGEGKIVDTLHYNKAQVIKSYINLEPRFAIGFKYNSSASFKASYVRNVQNLHLLVNSTTASPLDKWVASTNIIKPEISDQVAIGWYKDLCGRKFEFTAEAYYKAMQNQVDYRDGADIYINSDAIETQLLFGQGRAYGLELLLKKKAGKFSGWFSYTLSKSERQINGINAGKWYNAMQDRTHDISIVCSYKLNDKWVLSGNWVFNTGSAVTFPAGKYTVGGRTVYYYTERNAYRMPSYHRLDIGATKKLKDREKWSSELVFSLYNAYGRENAYTIQFRNKQGDPQTTEAVQIALFKFIPSISYNFKFK